MGRFLKQRWELVAFAVACIATVIAFGWFVPVLKVITIIFYSIAGIALGLGMVLFSGKIYTPLTPQREPSRVNELLIKIMENRASFKPKPRKVVMSKNLDLLVQEIMDYVTRDYIITWYDDLGKDKERFKTLLHDEVWFALEKFCDRLIQIEHVTFVTQDVTTIVYKHFQNIRLANAKLEEDEQKPKFILPPWLASEARELEYLRKVASVFCFHLLPEADVKCAPARHLLTEILACKVFKSAVDIICDPDYINQKLSGWLLYREQITLEHKRTYTYAANYEDFMRMIEQCDNIDHLKEMRFNIISEIMQATTIQNLKRARGQDTDKESSPKGTTKGDLLRARNLTRYINQLTVAKSHSEKRIYLLGGPDYKSYTSDSRREEHAKLPGRKVLSFPVIMENELARKHFIKYLQRDNNDAILRFWISVEKMRHSSRRELHQLGGDTYHMFIAHPTSLVRNKLDKATIKGMEAFMVGNKGPESFYEAQDEMKKTLEEKFYPSFIISDTYHKYIEEDIDLQMEDGGGDEEVKKSPKSPEKEECAYKIAEHSTYALQKLRALDDKIANKSLALQALKHSKKTDKKVLQLQVSIEAEIEQLRTERRQLEFHIDRTEVWVEKLGKWKANIYNAEMVPDESGMVPYFVILVHLEGHLNPKEHTQGWVVSRKLSEFHALHSQIKQIFPEYKKCQLPTVGKLRFRSIDKEFLDKAAQQLQEFLESILKDERAAQNESTFAFFSPSPEHLKFAPQPLKKAKFSLTSMIKGLSNQNQDSDSDEEFMFIDADGVKEERVRDSIAKPLYMLLNEVFELRGMFKWLRRTLMVFVKVSFGRSINRQLRDVVAWIISEPMLLYYITQFKDAYWPDGELNPGWPERTEVEKQRTRLVAKEKFLQLLVGRDPLKNLFGEENTRRGTIKIFEALQDIRLNKALFYELLEVFLFEVFPEIQRPETTSAASIPGGQAEQDPASKPPSYLMTF